MSKGARTRFYADVMAFHPGVTGSCNLVVVKYPDGETTKFLVDCGLFQEEQYHENNNKLLFKPEGLDFVLVTHNHVDHVGRLPYLVKQGYRKPIYMTMKTTYLIESALTDSCSVLKDLGKRNNVPPLYSDTDVQRTMGKIVGCYYYQELDILPNIKVTFFPNGHLYGAAIILVQISYPGYEDINLLFTGDYNNKNMFFDVKSLPEWVKNLPLTIVQEATYGTSYSKNTDIKCFEKNVSEALKQGKTVVTLVFSLGRAQEILYTLSKMQDEGTIPLDIPIYFDGKLAFRYTSIYLRNTSDFKPEMHDFMPYNLTYVSKDSRKDIMLDNSEKIIVTTSGMGSYGPAQVYIPEYLQRKNALIHFTGYTAEGTLGARLKNAEKGDIVNIGGLLVVKKADVEYTTEFSAHAKADEMIDFLNQFNKLKLVLINHGEQETKKRFADLVLREVDTKYVGILGEGYLFRVDPYGFVKTMNTKFE